MRFSISLPLLLVCMVAGNSVPVAMSAHAENTLSPSSKGCAAIAGQYKFFSDLIPSYNSAVRMDMLLFHKEIYPEKVRWADLSFDEDMKVHATFYLGEESNEGAVQYDVGAKCENGAITYDIFHDGYSDGTAYKLYRTNYLRIDDQGDLIVKSKTLIATKFFFITVNKRTTETETKFHKLKPATQGTQ